MVRVRGKEGKVRKKKKEGGKKEKREGKETEARMERWGEGGSSWGEINGGRQGGGRTSMCRGVHPIDNFGREMV